MTTKLRLERERAGLSRARLGAKAGIGPATVYRLERRLQTPTVPTLYALAAALDVPVAALLDDPDPVQVSSSGA